MKSRLVSAETNFRSVPSRAVQAWQTYSWTSSNQPSMSECQATSIAKPQPPGQRVLSYALSPPMRAWSSAVYGGPEIARVMRSGCSESPYS